MSKISRNVVVSGFGDVKLAASDALLFTPAIELLVGDANLNQAATTEGLVHEDVVVAILNNRVVGAIAAQVAPGQVGWIWLPVIGRVGAAPSASAQISRELVAAAVVRLSEADCRLAQALLLPGDPRARDLEANDFVRMTEMIRMERDCIASLDAPHGTSELEFVAFGPATERYFEEVIEQSYLESQDCPELDGVRSVAEALQSYKSADIFQPELWQLARRRGDWVGCVLLAHFPNESRCELQYMGVVPHARGQQLGQILCASIARCSARRSLQTVTLSGLAKSTGDQSVQFTGIH